VRGDNVDRGSNPWVATLRFTPTASRNEQWRLTISREGQCALSRYYANQPGPDVRAAAIAEAGFTQDGPWKWREYEAVAGGGVWRIRARCYLRRQAPRPVAADTYPCRTLEEQIVGSYAGVPSGAA
jgi:hypothetical protein